MWLDNCVPLQDPSSGVGVYLDAARKTNRSGRVVLYFILDYFFFNKERSMKRMDLIASANHLGMMARMAMKGGNYADALCWLSTGIDMLSSFPGGYNVAVPFLLHRAECLWQLGSVPESLTNLNEATRIGLPADFPFAEVGIRNFVRRESWPG